jgi:hypothetical protein
MVRTARLRGSRGEEMGPGRQRNWYAQEMPLALGWRESHPFAEGCPPAEAWAALVQPQGLLFGGLPLRPDSESAPREAVVSRCALGTPTPCPKSWQKPGPQILLSYLLQGAGSIPCSLSRSVARDTPPRGRGLDARRPEDWRRLRKARAGVGWGGGTGPACPARGLAEAGAGAGLARQSAVIGGDR